ncbi:MAG TPA: right-handed parallel beta-helix repeat-containing protein [Planctomycetota bacterium]|nr:right-handed parallel beta-helix repeat-containing protein [Planctomycetota bacterium]
MRTFWDNSVVNSVAFSPDGTKVLTGSCDRTAKLWDIITHACIRTFAGHTGYVWSVAFSPDGTNVLTGAAFGMAFDNTAKLWDAATGDCICTFTAHTEAVTSVAFSPEGARIVTGSYDGTAKLWWSGLVSDFYVNDDTPDGDIPAGDDANSGASPQAPMRHIQALLDRYPDIGQGFTVHVAPGTYRENIVIGPSHSGLTLQGAGAGTTVIDGNQAGRCIGLDRAASAIIDGFTITNGSLGGVFCYQSSPTISNNIVVSNSAFGISCSSSPATIRNNIIANNSGRGISFSGAESGEIAGNTITGNADSGIYCSGSSPTIKNCTITGNSAKPPYTGAQSTGGGAYLYSSSPAISNCTIAGNTATTGGGAYLYSSSPAISNCTIAGNTASTGGGIYCQSSSPTLTNCILWGDSAPIGTEISLSSSTLMVSHCDVAGGRARIVATNGCTLTWGPGNIETDPLFADPANNDWHLQSLAGRWDPAANGGVGDWVADAAHSPCIDAGDPASPFSNEQVSNGGRVNLGACGNTPEASKSYTGPAFRLTVRSAPGQGVPITGTFGGTTDFSVDAIASSEVTLWGWEGPGMFFIRWEDELGNVLSRKGKLTVRMDSDKTVVAIYQAGITDFYVNDHVAENGIAAGDDDNPGTSAEYPMASIQTLLDRYPNIGAGCTVRVSEGTYVENLSILASHSGLVLQGAGPGLATVDGNLAGPCLTLDGFTQGTIKGLTLTNGRTHGINCTGSAAPSIVNCLIAGNDGTGVSCSSSSSATLVNVTVTGNTVRGLYCSSSTVAASESIFWNNGSAPGSELCASSTANVSVRYSDVAGGRGRVLVAGPGAVITWGPGNIDADPLFANPAAADWHLKSITGRWDRAARGWVSDIIHSPCIDAGDPAAPCPNEPAPNGSRVNMGAQGNTPEASKSYTGPTRLLTVRSLPNPGVQISGTVAGTTDFAVGVLPDTDVTVYGWEGQGMFFDRWEDATGAVLSRTGRLTVCMDSDKTVVAVYQPGVTEFYVNDQVAEDGIGAGSDDNPGTSPEFPMASIQTLLNRYPSIGAGCTVHVSAGTYVGNVYLADTHSGLTLLGAGPDATTIDGNQAASCLRIDGLTAGTVTGFTFRNGAGGVYCRGSVLITGNSIIGNARLGVSCAEGAIVSGNTITANADGGVSADTGSTIANNTISGNTAIRGGGIACTGTPIITGNVISGNTADTYGGGICCWTASSPTISGNTISGNSAGTSGGGIWCAEDSSPSISGNTITGNTAGDGGGIQCFLYSVTISANTISGNKSAGYGGGIGCGIPSYAFGTGPVVIRGNTITCNTAAEGGGIGLHSFWLTEFAAEIANNVIAGNSATGNGGGICVYEVKASISNNTITANKSGTSGGAIFSWGHPIPVPPYCAVPVANSVLWGNIAPVDPEIHDELPYITLIPSYCDIAGYPSSGNNFSADPLFADPGHWSDNGTPADPADDFFAVGDYHLKSKHGRWDPEANSGNGGWVNDSVTSPCIDAGDPVSDYSKEPMPNFGRVNMGAYGNTAEASRSGWNIPADANADCTVNILDLIFIRGRMNQSTSTGDNWKADVNTDGRINILDLIYVRNKLNTKCQ